MNRDDALTRLADSKAIWDVIIVGGGATGLGAAVDAASRGYQTILLERADFAQETSSRSTKLIHGGVRYLKQGRIGLVRESLEERGLLLSNAPDLVHRLSFIIPVFSSREKWMYGAGLKAYDFLAGKWSLGPTSMLSRADVIEKLPSLQTEGLRGGVQYFDGQFDDARLAISLAKTLFRLGSVAVNRMEVQGFTKGNGRIRGVMASDSESGRNYELRGRVVINATGIFSDQLRRLDKSNAVPLLSFSQGAHLVLDRSFLPSAHAVMIPKTKDGRVLFAIPWHDRVLVGTTDTEVREPTRDPQPLPTEMDFLMEHLAKLFGRTPGHGDVRSVFAGIRPLLARRGVHSTSRLSREHALLVSESGLLTVTGGKWTTYRKMAEETIDKAVRIGELKPSRSLTRTLSLAGGAEDANINAAADLIRSNPTLGDRLHPRLHYRNVDVVIAARSEMARTVEDVLARRTRALFLDAQASMEAAPQAANLLATELGKDESWQRQAVDSFCRSAARFIPSAVKRG